MDTAVRVARACEEVGIVCLEEPFEPDELDAYARLADTVALPIATGEQLSTVAEFRELIERGHVDIIQPDVTRCGGLTEALALAAVARRKGLRVMAGCMVSTSLAMAPAMLLAQGADWVDLDGPLLLARDRKPALRYEGALVHPPEPALWG